MSNSRVLLPIFVLLMILPSASAIAISGRLCNPLLSSLARSPKSADIYIALVTRLAKEKGVLSAVNIEEMRARDKSPNPLDFLSRPLSPNEMFSYQKAFASLTNVDWTEIKLSFARLARELRACEITKEDAKNKTANVFTAVELKSAVLEDQESFHPTNLISRSPIIAYVRGSKTYVADLSSNEIRELSPWAQSVSFGELASGRVLVTNFKNLTLKIEDAITGEVIETLNFENTFPEASQYKTLQSLQINENHDGTLKMTFKWHVLNDYFVYDFKDKTTSKLTVPKDPHSIATTTNGGILYSVADFAAEKVGHNVKGLQRITSFKVTSEATNETGTIAAWEAGGTLWRQKFYAFPDGRHYSVVVGQNTLVFTDNNLQRYVVRNLDREGVQLDNTFLTEWPRGEPAVVVTRQIDDHGTEIILINKSGEFKRVNLLGAKHINQFRGFQPRNGNILFFALAESGGLYLVDFGTRSIQRLQLKNQDWNHLRKIYELEDGRIQALVEVGVATENFGLYQLYGPVGRSEP